ncbi:repressor [Martelella endophytica]|uniref:Repressor n=1 Tax=Martelella endophytica TaxID=1486262 RepID=A0A0D5LR71_MAREN|nr:repressor [Martelella endophytica]
MYTIPFLLAVAAPLAPADAHEPIYRNGVEIFLVRPDGTLLDYIPEYGSVVMGRDAYGRQTLLDANGDLVATEMTARDYQQVRRQPPGQTPESRGWQRDSRNARWQVPQGGYGAYTYPNNDNYGNGGWNGSASGNFGGEPLPQAAPQTSETRQAIAPAKLDMNVAALQVYLDRAGFSPGVIDGRMGDNVQKALAAYEEATGTTLDPNADSEKILASLSLDGGLPITTYTITAEDAAGPYVASIPSDYGEKAQLSAMSYTSVTEMLAEKFHMDERLLKSLNPDADFNRPGTTVKVVNPGASKKGSVARIIADKAKKQVLAYDEAGALIAAYPATIGSSDTPSPSGTVSVERIAIDPTYTYDPKKNFKQGNNDSVLTINPGPNGPVGNVWIALSKPSYGIHGTPDPEKIGKTSSHGCVRLTNWDATELAHMVKPGVTVEFVD